MIEKHTILTSPSIQVLDFTHQQWQKLKQSSTNNSVIVGISRNATIVGNPKMPSVSPQIGQPPQPLNSLPGAEAEAKIIASLLNSEVIIGDQATKTAVVNKMLGANVIHLATHGLLDDIEGMGIPGAIALAPSGSASGLLSASEIMNLKLNAQLVILSACDTGRGRITADGVIGLSRSFINAGASSVIVSLWKVSDPATAFLMPEFYHQLQQGSDKGKALRQAMLKTLQKYPEPKNWAAFTLIGEAN